MDQYSTSFGIRFVIKGMKFSVEFEDGFFDDNEKKDIENFVDAMSNEMHIDSSYVDNKETKYANTFMLEDGWNALCELIKDSKYGKYLHQSSQETLIEAFCMMGKCYIYECLSLLYDFRHIQVEVDPHYEFDVIFLKEDPSTWKHYPGKWQTWDDNQK